ncbi:MAG: 5-dehydro-4-deoxy-D-glucuronate isomerase [Desulfobacterota bacterium]|jgi:4-deoxy-L-threo-5-hexosulose-uronate ketol-isomerase|nr:5-dehydro-4-deoxy-D-glucuronate isomerase [Thermodesulfobacteriota bacterium]NTV42128.1 5-dehydro-4-deoxy-D-glucuronate isomerase [Syntrophobacteraceae bacterium]
MDIRYAVHPDHFKTLDSEAMRRHFLVQGLFVEDRLNMVYSHIDRIIVGGVCPVQRSVRLEVTKALGVDYFLQRREMGVINIGSQGAVFVDGTEHVLGNREGLYIGMGCKDISFRSSDANNPAKFYFNSTPAHFAHPVVAVSKSNAQQVKLGSAEKSNLRTINQFVHPNVLKSCQLVMGMTELAPGSVWNTMPSHTHDRRMEVYFYFNLPEDAVVFHLLGDPKETRHIVVRNEEAVITPSWSIHSGVGTANYTFIWGMAGENQTFTDMDDVPMSVLK